MCVCVCVSVCVCVCACVCDKQNAENSRLRGGSCGKSVCVCECVVYVCVLHIEYNFCVSVCSAYSVLCV